MYSIDIYNNSAKIIENKLPSKILSWTFILLLLSIIVVIFSFIPFNIYKTYNATIIKNDNLSYVTFYINRNDFPFDDKNKLYIKDKKYEYIVASIEDSIITLILNIDGMNINNNMLTINILKDRTTIFQIVKNKIMKGFWS